MPFANERIPDAMKESIGPIGNAQTNQPLALYMWTVDRERDAYLIRTGQDRDAPELVYFRLSIEKTLFNTRIIETIKAHPEGELFMYRLDAIWPLDTEKRVCANVLDTLRDALGSFAGLYGTVKVGSVEFQF